MDLKNTTRFQFSHHHRNDISLVVRQEEVARFSKRRSMGRGLDDTTVRLVMPFQFTAALPILTL